MKDNPLTSAHWLSIAEAAKTTTLGVRTIRRWLVADKHQLPSYRIGTRRMIKRVDLERWAQQFREDALRAETKRQVNDILRKVRG
jgi:excisionase family DNA binding protein